MPTKTNNRVEADTAEKIKNAARKLFQERGFAAVRTRDIAEESGINLALINYYFRSKKNLYDVIMMESVQSFFSGLLPILNNAENSLSEKIEDFVGHYIDYFRVNPDFATFILQSVREHPEDYLQEIKIFDSFASSVFVEQFFEAVQEGMIPPIHPLHFIMNLIGLIVFPFVAKPMIGEVLPMSEEDFDQILEERKKLVPLWMQAITRVELK